MDERLLDENQRRALAITGLQLRAQDGLDSAKDGAERRAAVAEVVAESRAERRG